MVNDGVEDADRDGLVDPGERDPNRKCDDQSLMDCAEPGAPDYGPARSLGGSGGCSARRAPGASAPLWLGLLAFALFLGARRRRP
jgi:MYXO-CTERM domain-containing protein